MNAGCQLLGAPEVLVDPNPLGRVNVLLEQGVLEPLSVELHPELVRTHPGGGEEHRVLDEVRGRRPPGRLRMDHQLEEEQTRYYNLTSPSTSSSTSRIKTPG